MVRLSTNMVRLSMLMLLSGLPCPCNAGLVAGAVTASWRYHMSSSKNAIGAALYCVITASFDELIIDFLDAHPDSVLHVVTRDHHSAPLILAMHPLACQRLNSAQGGSMLRLLSHPAGGGGGGGRAHCATSLAPSSPAGHQHPSSLESDCQSAHEKLPPCTGEWRLQPKAGSAQRLLSNPAVEARAMGDISMAQAAQLGISIYETGYDTMTRRRMTSLP